MGTVKFNFWPMLILSQTFTCKRSRNCNKTLKPVSKRNLPTSNIQIFFSSAQLSVFYFFLLSIITFRADSHLLSKCSFPSKSQPEALVFVRNCRKYQVISWEKIESWRCVPQISLGFFKWRTASLQKTDVQTVCCSEEWRHVHPTYTWSHADSLPFMQHRSSADSDRQTNLSLLLHKLCRGANLYSFPHLALISVGV